MTLVQYLIGALFAACLCASYENHNTRKDTMPIIFLTCLVWSLAWPLVALIAVGMIVRGWFVKGA